MYCSSCGSVISQKLTFCSRCGAKLRSAESSSLLTLDSLVWAIVSLMVAGVGVIIGLMAVMKNVVGLPESIIVVVTMLSFLALFTAEGVLIRILLGTWKGTRNEQGAAWPMEQTARELGEAQPRELPEPLPSVTEQATRTFEPTYSGRKTEG